MIIFAALIAGLVILVLQIGLLVYGYLIEPALAAGVFQITPAQAQQDIAFIMLDRVFGIPDLFQSCIDVGGPCSNEVGAIIQPGNLPHAFHSALHNLFRFYSMGLLIIGVLMLMFAAGKFFHLSSLLTILAFGIVLNNIISNAIKYTPPEGNINIEATHNASSVMIKVIDNGAGIPQENIEKILDPFTRVENNPHLSQEEGTGLGLSIVNSLLKLHDGKLSIESELGVGTTVTVSFPL